MQIGFLKRTNIHGAGVGPMSVRLSSSIDEWVRACITGAAWVGDSGAAGVVVAD